MIFSIEKDILSDYLTIIQKGLPVKNTMPILMGIKLEVLTDKIVLTSNNSDIAVKAIINKEKVVDIKETGAVVIPGSFFIEIVRKITSRVIEVALFEDTILTIKADRSEFKLRVMEVLDYPRVDFVDQNKAIELDVKTIKAIHRETAFAAALNEKRPIITGINLRSDGNNLICTATDSFRLAQKTLALNESVEPFNITVPSKSFALLAASLDSFGENISIFTSINKILFKIDEIYFQSRLLDGAFPDITRLIPSEFPIIVKFNKEELIAALDRVSLFASKEKDMNQNVIKFHLRIDHVVEITSTNNEIGDALEEVIPCDTVYGPVIKIAFSSKYLVDSLKSFNSSEVSLNFTGEIKPFIIKAEHDQSLINLILPVKIDQ
ncbi:MAG: DNA polymerase III subunit beta [Erysipelotrichales bacterium]|nr:DNA polymerase III subunit beta [Erysipelotrichales bacterium]